MTSQLVGNCVVFHVAFCGPSKSGKTQFCDRWHRLQAFGTLEAGGRLHQLRFVVDHKGSRQLSFRSVVTGRDGDELLEQTSCGGDHLSRSMRSHDSMHQGGGGGNGGLLNTAAYNTLVPVLSCGDDDLSSRDDDDSEDSRARNRSNRRRTYIGPPAVSCESLGGPEMPSLDHTATFTGDRNKLLRATSAARATPDLLCPTSAAAVGAGGDRGRRVLSRRPSSVHLAVGDDDSPPRTVQQQHNARRRTSLGAVSGAGDAQTSAAGALPYVPTTYSRVVRSTVVLPDCASAAVHRMFLYDTPGSLDRFSIPAALLSGKSLSTRLNGVVVCVDGRAMQRDSLVADQVNTLMELCDKYGIAVLVMYRGAAIPAEFSRRDSATTMFISCEIDDFTQCSKAFTLFLSQLHAVELRARQLELQRIELQKVQIIEHIKRPRQLIPTQKRIYIEPGHRQMNCCDDSDDYGRGGGGDGGGGDHPPPILVVLIGAAASGKSTFLSAIVDDFVLSHYEPTTRLETGSCCLVSEGEGWHRNIVLLEGPLDDVYAAANQKPDIGIVFVDASSLGALVEAAACVNEIESVHYRLPPCLCVCITKQGVDDFVHPEEVGAWAADLGAYMAGYQDPRDRQSSFFLSLMGSYLNDIEALEQQVQREMQLAVAVPSAAAPAVSVVKQSSEEERRFVAELIASANAAEEAKLMNAKNPQRSRQLLEEFKLKKEHEQHMLSQPQHFLHNSSHHQLKMQQQQRLTASSKNQASEFVDDDYGRTAAMLRVTRQQRVMSLLRQASQSFNISSVNKAAEFENGTFVRSVRQAFDRKDIGATGFISKADATELLATFDPAGMFVVADEIRFVCNALPCSSNAHGFVNFDQFVSMVCRVAGRT